MYIRSKWNPPDHLFPFPKAIPRRINAFKTAIRPLARQRQVRSNLLPHQRRALQYLRSQHDFLIINCDKNLGPAIIERSSYVRMAFRDHLSDSSTYERLSPAAASRASTRIRSFLSSWLARWHADLTKNERRFLRHHLDNNVHPFAVFYITAKVHKSPLKSRPIVSCSGSLLYALGVWVDDKLQHAAQAQRSYFKSTFDLKKELDDLVLPAGARLFIADAVSMYTSIPTDRALNFIGAYLRRTTFPGIPTEALMEALRFVMKNNVFTFGDTIWRQLTGTAMGTPPAPPWATLYFSLNENAFLDTFPGRLFFYRRFIDDVFGVWVPPVHGDPASDPDWIRFQSSLDNPTYGLIWEVGPLSTSVDFMDLTISIRGCRLHTTLYEKPSNHHLYIPPHSCHPPGLLPGMIFGMIFRFYSLCTDSADVHSRIRAFLLQLRRRGYPLDVLRPFFLAAIRRYSARSAAPSAPSTLRDKMLLHVQFHPKNPPSFELQRLWKLHISEPPYGMPLRDIRNWAGDRLGIDRLIVAYSRPLNLGNLLSYRNLKNTQGPPVSSFATGGG